MQTAWSENTETKPESKAQLQNAILTLKEIKSLIKRSEFELNPLLEALDFDGDEIAKFVASEIDFQQYPGVLRGAVGTLMSRAGNSADQALLLATLLNNAGYESRIARTTLDLATASQLISAMGAPRSRVDLFSDKGKSVNALQRLFELSGNKWPDKDDSDHLQAESRYAQELTETIDRSGHQAIPLLKHVGPRLDDAQSANRLLEEARDYYWVQWKVGPSSPWMDSHPAFDGRPVETELKATSFYKDTLPPEIQTRLKIGLSIERVTGDKSETIVVAQSNDMPTANLVGAPITVAIVPNTLQSLPDIANITETLRNAQLWTPVINKVQGSLSFDLHGNVVSPDAAAAPAAGLFQTMGQKMGSAAGGLGASLPEIGHVWLSYQLTRPGGSTKIYKTDLFAKHLLDVDPATDPEMTKKALLSSSHSIMVNTGRYGQGFILDKSLERVIETVKFISANAERKASGQWQQDVPKLHSSFIGQYDMYSLIDSATSKETGQFSYRNGPSIITYSQFTSAQGTLKKVVNIVANPRMTYRKTDSGVTPYLKGNIVNGILESNLEEKMIASEEAGSWSAASTLEQHIRSIDDITVIDNESDKILANLDETLAQSIASDLGAGYVVIIPTSMLEQSVKRPVWWRVNPESGETLAMMNSGYGVYLTEYQVVNIIGWSGFAGFWAGYLGCVGDINEASASKNFQCGLCGLFAGATAALAAGLVVSGTLTTLAAAALWGESITIPAGVLLKDAIITVASAIIGVLCGVRGYAD